MAPRDREFKLSRKEFDAIRGIVYDRTGITLKENKEEMVYSRLSRRIRALAIADFKSYLDFLHSDEGQEEASDFVNAMTTNLTRFFRESHHFEHLRHEVIKAKVLAARAGVGNRTLRIWSAGCSSGMEPYSIAMTVMASLPAREKWDVQILATDIDTNMLDRGREGIYRPQDADGIPAALLRKYVTESDDSIYMADELKSLISFKYMNFMDNWPIKRKFDVIFCRNVMIYFDKETQTRLVKGFVKLLEPDGVLYVGHAEALVAKFDELVAVGRSSFKVATAMQEYS